MHPLSGRKEKLIRIVRQQLKILPKNPTLPYCRFKLRDLSYHMLENYNCFHKENGEVCRFLNWYYIRGEPTEIALRKFMGWENKPLWHYDWTENLKDEYRIKARKEAILANRQRELWSFWVKEDPSLKSLLEHGKSCNT